MSNTRGIRGAITAAGNNKKAILSATKQLLNAMVSANKLKLQDIACVIFSATKELKAEFPATAARQMGWKNVPLMCASEINVPGSIKNCIRVLMMVNSNKPQSSIKHIYLGKAKKLRPDLG